MAHFEVCPNDTPLEDIERIEVIHGPGGILWGANATNGAINIITKKAKHTQGGVVTVVGGSKERAFTTMQYGGKIGQDVNVRIYGKAFDRGKSVNTDGAHDDWRMDRSGFRADWDMAANDSVPLSAIEKQPITEQ